ncbi:KIF-binding protein [Manis javanica]|nr:KIF-binding protein [Manis javanica]
MRRAERRSIQVQKPPEKKPISLLSSRRLSKSLLDDSKAIETQRPEPEDTLGDGDRGPGRGAGRRSESAPSAPRSLHAGESKRIPGVL